MVFEERPWGNYTVLYTDSTCQVKKLAVNPGMRLSLQSHQFRAEHWFIVSGQGIALLDNLEISVKPGDSIDVPIGAKHRISCTSESGLVFIEVQTGTSFDEADITRFSDDYGRTSNE
jgi:mannose-6-phosphate isomerase-like protein (cupin superfamily)